ncbi:Uncharacterised protein [Mycobacteroides abscessus subsp. abscessus]|nr:Uncharacterised protein [Mycobacteroides abscessus subsp. abscessus]
MALADISNSEPRFDCNCVSSVSPATKGYPASLCVRQNLLCQDRLLVWCPTTHWRVHNGCSSGQSVANADPRIAIALFGEPKWLPFACPRRAPSKRQPRRTHGPCQPARPFRRDGLVAFQFGSQPLPVGVAGRIPRCVASGGLSWRHRGGHRIG